uniref:Uncharacterized protein n=1 Tax=Oryza glumipatula TaxID=40148 RepID=A0A0E0A6H9_9ORYZ
MGKLTTDDRKVGWRAVGPSVHQRTTLAPGNSNAVAGDGGSSAVRIRRRRPARASLSGSGSGHHRFTTSAAIATGDLLSSPTGWDDELRADLARTQRPYSSPLPGTARSRRELGGADVASPVSFFPPLSLSPDMGGCDSYV